MKCKICGNEQEEGVVCKRCGALLIGRKNEKEYRGENEKT